MDIGPHKAQIATKVQCIFLMVLSYARIQLFLLLHDPKSVALKQRVTGNKIGVHSAMQPQQEHVFDDGYLVYLLLVFLSTSVFFNFGGLLALLYAKYKQREMGGD